MAKTKAKAKAKAPARKAQVAKAGRRAQRGVRKPTPSSPRPVQAEGLQGRSPLEAAQNVAEALVASPTVRFSAARRAAEDICLARGMAPAEAYVAAVKAAEEALLVRAS